MYLQVVLTVNEMLKSMHPSLVTWVLLVSCIWDTRLQISNWMAEDHSSYMSSNWETYLQVLISCLLKVVSHRVHHAPSIGKLGMIPGCQTHCRHWRNLLDQQKYCSLNIGLLFQWAAHGRSHCLHHCLCPEHCHHHCLHQVVFWSTAAAGTRRAG